MALHFQLQLQSTYNATSINKSSPSPSFYRIGRKLRVSDSISKKDRPLLWQRGPAPITSVRAVSRNSSSSDAKKGGGGGGGLPSSNYVVPLDKSFSAANSSCITRPLAEILRDLNKRIPDNIIKTSPSQPPFIPWYHANRMLSFYAPGWCGEVRDVIYSDNGCVTVVYRVTITGSDGEAYRESSGTICWSDKQIVDPAAAAEEIAFCRACARFGLGLYLYHEE